MHNGSLPRKTAKEKNEINSKLSDPDTWKHGKCNSYWWVEIPNALFRPAASYCVVLKLYCETLGCWNFYILLIFRPRKRDENIWIIRHLINTVKLSSMSHGKSSLLDNVSEREAILVLFGFSEVNNTWLQRPSNSLITCARIDCIFYRFTGVIDHVGCWESRRNGFRITRLLLMSYKSAG